MDLVATRTLQVRRLAGLQPYQPVWRAMQAFTDNRDARTDDELWLLEHEPVFTQGQAGRAEHLLAPGEIPVVQVDRGGQVTYHGPGQLVAYPLIDLRRLGIGIKALVQLLEQAIIDTLTEWDIHAERLAGAPGAYVDGSKVASLGLRVRRGRSFHGLALNVAMDLEPFARINPCGLQGMQVVDCAGLGGSRSVPEVAERLTERLAAALGLTTRQASPNIPDHC